MWHSTQPRKSKRLPAGQYDLFISHAWSEDVEYRRVVGYLNQIQGLQWRNLSVPSHDPVDFGDNAELEELIRSRVVKSHACILSAGLWTSRSTWIKFEIDCALKARVPVVAFKPFDQIIPNSIVAVSSSLANDDHSLERALRRFGKPRLPRIAADA